MRDPPLVDGSYRIDVVTNDPSQATRTISASGTGVSTGLVQRLATNPIATVGFGTVTSGSNRTIAVQLFNVSTADSSVTSISRTGGISDFSLNPAPSFPIAIPVGGESDITLQFAPSGSGAVQAEFTIASDDLRSPLKLTASGVGVQASSGFWAKIPNLLRIAHPQSLAKWHFLKMKPPGRPTTMPHTNRKTAPTAHCCTKST